MDGRGLIEHAPAGYPPESRLWMVKDPAVGVVRLSEPMSGTWNRMGPMGLFGAERLKGTEASVVAVNAGVGGSRTDQWVPGTGNFINCANKVRSALRSAGTRLAGYVVFIGLNDAAAGMTGQQWLDNTSSTLEGLKAEFGDAPVLVVRYPASAPTDVAYATHAEIREAMATAPFASAVVDAPEGPWHEVTKVHLNTEANLEVARRLADKARDLD